MNRPAFATMEFNQLPEDMRRSLQEVEQAYGRQFSLWVKDPEWSCCHDIVDESTSAVVPELLDAQYDPDRPVVATCADGGRLMIVPLANAADISSAAVAFVEIDEELLQQYLATAWQLRDHTQRLEQTSQQLWAYADHVSHDSEQICWLQSLADNIEVCDPRRGLEHVSGIVLPGLRDLLGAEEIVLFAIEDSQQLADSALSQVM
ncbi:MAG: hypothetical protein B7Z55_00740 [Planctomycetales bacterium 12-60-4]|nr:MAG: hypothetical protein B7Z55_00740 [Planctomycetales bacterium 12-60-4]